MNSIHETSLPLHPCCDQFHQKHALMEVLNRILNRIKQSKQHSGLCLQQVTAAERFISSQEKEQLHSGFDQGPLVWHYQLARAVSRAPALPHAPGHTTCSPSVQMNSFTHDQGGEYDLLTPSGEKGKVYAHKNDIPEHRAAGASKALLSKLCPGRLLCRGSTAQITAPLTAPLLREPSNGQGLGKHRSPSLEKPRFPSLILWSGWGYQCRHL